MKQGSDATFILATLETVAQHGRIDDSERRMNDVCEAIAAARRIEAENATLRTEIERLNRLLDNANSRWETPK